MWERLASLPLFLYSVPGKSSGMPSMVVQAGHTPEHPHEGQVGAQTQLTLLTKLCTGIWSCAYPAASGSPEILSLQS